MERKYKSGAIKCKEQESKKDLIASCVLLTSYFSSFQHNPVCDDGMTDNVTQSNC